MHLFVLITILLLTSGKVYCQVVLPGSIQYLEGDSYQDPVKSIYHSWDGKGLSPIGTFRCLNIFINIIYDQAPATNPINESNTYEWPRADLESVNQYTPSYLSDFTDSEYSGPNSVSGFQTRLMYESSFGNFIVLGDFIVVNTLMF